MRYDIHLGAHPPEHVEGHRIERLADGDVDIDRSLGSYQVGELPSAGSRHRNASAVVAEHEVGARNGHRAHRLILCQSGPPPTGRDQNGRLL
jgi:hypothetical protein